MYLHTHIGCLQYRGFRFRQVCWAEMTKESDDFWYFKTEGEKTCLTYSSWDQKVNVVLEEPRIIRGGKSGQKTKKKNIFLSYFWHQKRFKNDQSMLHT